LARQQRLIGRRSRSARIGVEMTDERVPDEVQRERARGSMRNLHFPDCAREWCTADPGPPKTEFSAVPGLQRTAAYILCSIASELAALRCARDTRHLRACRCARAYGACSPFYVVVVLLLLAIGAVAAIQFPPLTGRVVDQANVIPAQNRSALEGKLKELEEKSGIQLVVATVSSLQGNDIETFANELFRYWKLGETTKNNGVLLLVAPTEHKVRIEVGYGLEGTLTDALSNVIITGAIIPRFKTNDYAGGIDRGVDGIISVLTTDAADWKPRTGVRTDDRESLLDQLMPFILILVFILIFRAMTRNARQGPSGRFGSRGGPIIFIPSGGSGWGGSSGSGWGGGGGGGFSGGGGSSGGGGASGSW
jgi:uncharacterized protein